MSELELFRTVDGAIVAFLGAWGSRGVFVLQEDGEWKFSAWGSVVFDGLHQQVYRNQRAEPFTEEELRRAGHALPDLERLHELARGMDWGANFESSVPLQGIPPALVEAFARVRRVWVAMYEDSYETTLGDGRFIYPEAVFLALADAVSFMDRRQREAAEPEKAPDPAKARFYKYYLKEVPISVEKGELRAALGLQGYEHLGAPDIVRLVRRAAEDHGQT